MIVNKTYTVWYWHDRFKAYRVGQTYKNKNICDKFIKSLKPYQYIGTTVKYLILDDDVA